MAGEASPQVRTEQARVAAVGTAGNDLTSVIGEAPFAGTVTAVSYVPDTAITGANTNSRTISLVNKGQDGTGSTTVASLALTSGVNIAAADEGTVTLSGTAANRVVASGDVLAFVSTHVGSGIVDPGGLARVQISRTAGS
jgi:hypothetical protein